MDSGNSWSFADVASYPAFAANLDIISDNSYNFCTRYDIYVANVAALYSYIHALVHINYYQFTVHWETLTITANDSRLYMQTIN